MKITSKNRLFIVTICHSLLFAAVAATNAATNTATDATLKPKVGGYRPTHPPIPFNEMRLLNPKNDFVFKKIMNNKNILLPIINSAFNDDFEEIIEMRNTVMEAAHAIGRTVAFDIYCKTKDNRSLIIEMQLLSEKSFTSRSVYYASRAYGSQLDGKEISNREKKYDVLQPVYFLAFVNFNLFPNKKDYISTHVLKDNKTNEIDIHELIFTFVELRKLKKKRLTSYKQLQTDLEKFAYFLLHDFGNSFFVQILSDLINTTDWINLALQTSNKLSWSQSDIDTYNDHEDAYMRLDAMLDAGIEKARQEGREEGEKETKKKMILNVIQTTKYEAKEVAKLLGLSEAEVKEAIQDQG